MASPNPNRGNPLGLAKGSVRSIVVLLLIGAVVFIAVALTVRAVLGANEEFVREAFLLVFAALSSLASLAAGFYFGTRSNANGDPT